MSFIDGKWREAIDKEAILEWRLVIYKSFDFLPLKIIKLSSFECFFRTKFKILSTNGLFLTKVIWLDWIMPTTLESMIGEIPSKLFLKLGTKWALIEGWLTKFLDARIGWWDPSATSTESEADVRLVISRLSLT